MPTTPFTAEFEALLKDPTQGGRMHLLTGLRYDPKFYCCISGNTVGVDKDPVPVLVVSPTQACVGAAVNADYSRSWSGTDTLAGNPWEVNWGDGNTSNGNFPNPRNPAAENVNHPLGGYALVGVYDVTLEVTDTLGATGSVTVQVEVVECGPPAPGAPPLFPLAYAACGLSGVWRSTDGAITWTQIGTGSLYNAACRDMKPMLATLPTGAIDIWVASENGLHFTRNGGDSWWRVDLPSADPDHDLNFADPYALACEKISNCDVYVLAMDYYQGGQRPLLYHTQDRGLSWDFIGFSAMELGEPSYMEWIGMDDGTIADDITQYVSYSDGTLLAVGEWLFGANTRYLAIWDGTNWSAASINGLPVVGQIYHAAISASDTLYILGEWDFGAGLEAAVYYWHIGVSSWIQVGTQVALGSGTHHLSIAPNGYVYAAVADKLYRVQDPGWATIATFWYTAPTVPHANCLEYIGPNEFYIGGVFETINGAGAYWNIARYDGSFHNVGAGLQFYPPEAIAIDPGTGYIYTGTNDIDPDRVFTYWNGAGWIHMTGYGHNLQYPRCMYYRDGRIWIGGRGRIASDQRGYVYIYDLADDTLDYFVRCNPAWPGGSSWIYDIHWPAGSPWMHICGDYTSPPSGGNTNASYSNEYNTDWLAYDEGSTYSLDTTADGRYVYVVLDMNLNGVTHAPIIIRVEADLSDYTEIEAMSGQWGGIVADKTLPNVAWIFGQLDGWHYVWYTDDYGDSLDNRRDTSWPLGHKLCPLLISDLDPSNIVVVLNTLNEVWASGDFGQNWTEMGTVGTAFDAQCGALNPANDIIMMIGREGIGADHLQLSVNLGYQWQERSTGITPQAPIVAVFMVAQ